MSEQPDEQSAPKRQNFKTALDVSLTMALITSSEYLFGGDGLFPKLIRIFAPLIGLITSNVVTYYIRRYEDNQDEKRIQEYIDKIDKQLSTIPSTFSLERTQALRDEQTQHHGDLVELRRARTKRRII